MLDSKLNACLGDFGLTCVENEKISYEEIEGLLFFLYIFFGLAEVVSSWTMRRCSTNPETSPANATTTIGDEWENDY